MEKSFTKGSKLNANDALEYIFEVKSGSDRNKIITNITTNFLSSKKGLLDLYFLFWDAPELTRNLYTDMNRDEFFTFFDLLRGKRESKPLLLGDNVGIPASTGLEDGIAKNSIAFEEALREYLQSLSILTEQAQVEIYNATKESGIAGNLSKQISSYGVNVVKVGNFSEERFYTQILLFSEDESVFPNTLSIISKAVKLADFEFEIRDPEESGNFTGDIVIILGQDYVDSL
ncbi:MAG: hypothetical protein KatS3mg085_377 [Candidatus Dojkabacteria bacterium]|nr:MAG: hypothetical protein KatS3mg085_377 [Candidatus Dojkabacteria bacterium]